MSARFCIYLDHNATTPLDPHVADAMANCWRDVLANPASQHRAGQRARRVLEESRETVARLLGANVSSFAADRVVLTSGGTESNNLALFGLAGQPPATVIISSIEHPSVTGPAEELQRRGFAIKRIRALPSGITDVAHFRELLDEGPVRLVSVMLGNNETGVLQPVAEVAALAREAGAKMHTDAAQVAGKLPVDFQGLGVDALTIAAHKFHGPVGIGALLLRAGVDLQPWLHGGFQQLGLRPGTEPVALAVGMSVALERWRQEAESRAARISELRDRLETRLQSSLGDIVINGQAAPRLPHTSNIAFPGVDRQAALLALDMAGVACSTGSACASGSSEPSPVLLAMGCPEEIVASSLRFSIGAFTTAEEIDEAAARIQKAISNLRRFAAT